MMPSRTFRERMGDHFDWSIHHMLRAAPLTIASAVGAPLGAYAGAVTRKNWTLRADAALAELRPCLDSGEREALLRWRWRHLGRVMTEFSHLHRITPSGRVEVVGKVDALDAPGPRLVVSAHLGNWELVAATTVERTGRAVMPYQPPNSPSRHAIARAARARLVGIDHVVGGRRAA
ncbi:MAG: hypothetical protein ACKVGZ_21500, partial [Alphaproteobacteria bacterium]